MKGFFSVPPPHNLKKCENIKIKRMTVQNSDTNFVHGIFLYKESHVFLMNIQQLPVLSHKNIIFIIFTVKVGEKCFA